MSSEEGDARAAVHVLPHARTRQLVLGSLGVVFGDIATSPLYTFQECLQHHRLAIDAGNVLGVVSLIFWALTLVVTVKYVGVLMRADNRGEGGIMALLALVPAGARGVVRGRIGAISLMVIAGAALLFGDGVITPAISVLSAMEGLVVAEASLAPYVVPATILILLGLFLVQRRGTGTLGTLFGPIMLAWLATIAVLGAANAVRHPQIFAALLPHHAWAFFTRHGPAGVAVLGSVVLAVTGGEALYADMGHFGRRPIRIAWLAVAYPCLTLCYLGQGALLLARPDAATAPFFALMPAGPWTYALVLLAAAATVIASQGLISAMFSLTHQAVRLGYLPRVRVLHTSAELEGRIYVPVVNWSLALACLALVAVFQHSSRLAAAFGLAVSGTMALTSVIFAYVTHKAWGWPAWRTAALLGLFLLVDLPFLGATCLKFFDGGYLPFALGALMFLVMSTYLSGRSLLADYFQTHGGDLPAFLAALDRSVTQRLPGLGVVMSATPGSVPPVLSLMVRRFRAVHEHVFLLSVATEGVPHVPPSRRVELEDLGLGFQRVTVRYGFLDIPAVPPAVGEAIQRAQLPVRPEDVLYVLSRESFLATDRGHMRRWREAIFAFLSRNAANPSHTFELPAPQVLELGSRIDL